MGKRKGAGHSKVDNSAKLLVLNELIMGERGVKNCKRVDFVYGCPLMFCFFAVQLVSPQCCWQSTYLCMYLLTLTVSSKLMALISAKTRAICCQTAGGQKLKKV